MKRKLFLPIVFLMAVCAFAREPERGYRGFVEWDNNLTTSHKSENISAPATLTYWITGLSTSHGFQINRNMFLGAGVMVETDTEDTRIWTSPVYFQLRYDRMFGKFSPFADLRIGYNMCNGGGIYFSPTIGYRFNWGRKTNINIGLGLTVRGAKENKFICTEQDNIFDIRYDCTRNSVMSMFNIRLGFDF